MSSNSNVPKGLVPVRYLNGSSWNGEFSIYHHEASDGTALFIGDPVKSAGGSDTTGRFADVIRAAAGDTVLGVVIGFGTVPTGIQGVAPAELYNPANLYQVNGLASTDYYVAVVDDPFIVCEIQENSSPSALAATNVGQNFNLVAGAGNTNSGFSGFQLDSNSAVAATGTTGQLRLLRLKDSPDNALGQYAKWFVMFNLHEYRASIAST